MILNSVLSILYQRRGRRCIFRSICKHDLQWTVRLCKKFCCPGSKQCLFWIQCIVEIKYSLEFISITLCFFCIHSHCAPWHCKGCAAVSGEVTVRLVLIIFGRAFECLKSVITLDDKATVCETDIHVSASRGKDIADNGIIAVYDSIIVFHITMLCIVNIKCRPAHRLSILAV